MIDFIPQALAGSRPGRALEVVVGVLMLGFLAVFAWYGWLLTLQSQGNTSPMLVLPRPLWYVSVPVSGVVMIGYTMAQDGEGFQAAQRQRIEGLSAVSGTAARTGRGASCREKRPRC